MQTSGPSNPDTALWHSWDQITEWMMYLLLVAAGALGYLLLALWLPLSPAAFVVGWILFVWQKVGVTFPVLALLSIYLVVVTAQLVIAPTTFRRHPREHLQFIEETSPVLGFLGTLIGMAEAISAMAVAKGMHARVDVITAGTGEAIYSSIYGALQLLVAYGVRFTFGMTGVEKTS